MKSMRNKIFGILFSLGIIFLFVTSCEVGMGASVDTEPPELVINTPESASIIRGTFALNGTWTDDQVVAKVSCTLTNTENEQKKYYVEGEASVVLPGHGEWTITVEKDSIPDGSYDASVSVFDAVGHETKAIRQFVIDNTPPVVVLKRPSSRKGEIDNNNIDGYGQLFTLNGLAADDSGVGLIEVSIYSDEELANLVKTVSIKNVPNTISLDVAEFREGEANDYSIIYGSTSRTAGEQKRWCKVIAYDGAQFYPADGTEQSEEDKKGNAATGYFLYEDLSSTLLNTYKITDLYAMLNGSYTGERSAANSVISTLDENKIDAGVFTLNPANNPTYTLSGYQELKMDGTDFGEAMSVKNGNSLVITVKPGLDSYEINQDSLNVYLQQCNTSGVPVGNRIPMTNITKEASGTSYIITVPVNKDENIVIGKNYLLIVEGQDIKENPVKTKGNGYGFYFDSNGVKPTLKVTVPPSAATVSYKEKTVNNGIESDTVSITLTGTVKFPSDTCEDGGVIIKDSTGNLEWNVAYVNPAASGATTGPAATISANQLDTELTWNKTLYLKRDHTENNTSDNDPYLPDGNHELLVYAFAGSSFAESGSIVYVERNIKVDTSKPKVPALTNLQDAVFDTDKWYDRQSLSAIVDASDNPRHSYASGLSKTEYRVVKENGDTGNWTSLASTTGGVINGFGQGENRVYLRSVDIVGNVSTYDASVYSTVKVDTVLPKIVKASIGSESNWDEFTSGSIKNIQSTHGKYIQLEIGEDHIRDVTVTLITPNDSDPSNPIRTNLPGSIPTTAGGDLQQSGTTSDGAKKYIWTSSAEADLTENKTITIEVVVNDQVVRETPTSAEYKVLVDTEGPNIEIITPSTDLEGADSLSTTTTLQANVSDAAGNVAVTKYRLTDTQISGDIKAQARSDSASSNGWETSSSVVTCSTGTIDHGKWYFYIYSKDDAGNESLAQRYFWFDAMPPSLGITDATKPKETYYNLEDKNSSDANRNTVKVSGTADDLNGIKEIKYQLDAASSSDESSWHTIVIPATPSRNVAWNLSFSYGDNGSDLSQGSHTLKIRAKDGSEKETIETFTILIDTVTPVITPENPLGTIERNGATFKDWRNDPKTNEDFSVVDAISSNLFVYYSIDTEPALTADWPYLFKYNKTEKRAAGAIEFETNGEKTVYVKAIDDAGNISTSNFKRYIDTEIDTISAKHIMMGADADGVINNFGGTTYVNESADNKMTLWGQFIDSNSGVAGITLKIDDDNSSTNDVIEATITYSTNPLPSSITSSTPLPTDFAALPAENPDHPEYRTDIKSWKAVINGNQFKTGKLIVTAKDIAGNEVDAQEILNIAKDTTPPVINTETITIADTSTNTDTKKYACRTSNTSAIEYYVDPYATYKIKGTSSDNNGMASTKLVIGDYTYTSSSASAWEITIPGIAANTDPVSSVTATLIATDVAGNQKTESIIFKYDNKPPVLSGDLNINGSAYAEGMWSSKTVLTETANLTDSAITDSDTGSGAAKIYFKRYETSPGAEERSGFISNYRSSKDGIITYSANGGSVTGLTEGKNYLLFIAEDNVGNAKLLSTTHYYVCVDTKSPTAEADAQSSGSQYTNGSTAVVLSGSCSDPDSGTSTNNTITGGSTVQSVTVSVEIGTATQSVTVTPTQGTESWTATIPAGDLSGIVNGEEYDIMVTAKDVAGNKSTPLKIATLKGDINAPTVELNSIVQSVESGIGDDKKYFVRKDTALTVKGVTEEDISTTAYTWLKLVPYPANSADTNAVKYIGTNTDGNGAVIAVTDETTVIPTAVRPWTLQIPANTIDVSTYGYTGAKLYICTKDLAGNPAVYEKANLEFDITAPEFLTSSDDANFVAYTIGGGTYNADKYHNSENLIVTGTWKDTQAGVSIVYYEKVAPNDDGTAGNSTITAANADRTTDPFNSFTVTNQGNGLYTFSTEIRDLSNGTNQIIMYAKDSLGNYSSRLTGIIKVDTLAPGGTQYSDDYSFTSAHLINDSADYPLYFYASDTGIGKSGIDTSKLPVITLGSGEPLDYKGTYEATATDGQYKVTVNIKKETLENISGYKPVVVTIWDIAGNENNVNITPLNIDKEFEEISLNTPVDADTETAGIQVNGIITISGTANDKNIKERPLTKFEYSTDETTWTDLVTDFSASNSDVVNAEVFSVTLDTTDDTKFTDNTTYYVRATASDEAGNSKVSNTITFTVNQDTDRPVITFMDITVPSIAANNTTATEATIQLVNSKRLRVTVTDDDGISSFTTKIGATTLTAASSSNGTYVYELKDANAIADGLHDIEFTVVDTAAGTTAQRTFKFGTAKAPKLTDGTHKMNKADVAVKLMSDSISPVSSETKYTYYTGTYPTSPTWATTVPALGGDREKFAVKITAGDENKIASVSAKISTAIGDEVSTTTVERDTNTTDTLTSGKYYSTWIIKDIDLSETAIPTGGNYKLELTITDCASNTRTDSVQLSIDRTAPVLSILSPKPVAGNNTTYSAGSIKANGTISGASTLRYVVTTSGDTAPAESDYSDEITFSTTWNIDFDGNTTATTGVHTKLLNTYLIDFGFTTQANLDKLDNPYSTITPLYLWLKAVDDVGNKTETPFQILVNPQGDRPTIKISNPQEFEQVFGNEVTIYGTFKDTLGTSADKIGVKSAWVQIVSEAQGDAKVDLNYLDPDPNVSPRAFWRLSHLSKAEYSDDQLPTDANGLPISRITAFNMAKVDLDYLAGITDASGNPVYKIYNMKTYKGDGTDVAWISGSSTIPTGSTPNDYAILARMSGAAWNLTINSQGEFNPNNLQNPKRNLVAIQVYAKDGDDKLNTVKENKYVFFDSDTPLITDLELEQYDSDENLIATRTYKADMYISFRNNTTWKLKGKATDDRCITSLKIDGTAQTISGTNATENFTCDLTKSGNVGTISFEIEAKDDASHTGKEEISIRFDDQAPELTTSGDSYNIKTIIQQENGFYKFGSVAKEEPASDGTSQSGFAYTAFYFKRGNKLYDILKAKASSTISANVSADDSGFTYDSQDHLYWYTKTIDTRENAVNTLTLASGQSMTGIRKNGLVKIDGTYYRINDVDTTANTFEIDGTPVASATTVYVAAAALIDNEAKEGPKAGKTPAADGYYAADELNSDDGDRMVEYVYKSGTSWEWEASVCSKNIADGPVKLVYVVFDEAGNFVSETVDGIICNNTPRIAGFSIYTDYNNNGTVNDAGKDGKYEAYLASTYSAKAVTGTTGTAPNTKNVYDPDAKSSVTNQKNPLKNKIVAYTEDPDDEDARLPVMTLRGKTKIIPEIVGGNGDVFYDYTIRTTTGSGAKKLFTGSTDYTINSKAINIQLGDLVSIGDVDCTEFKFTFRDSMEDRAKLDTTDYSFTAAQKEEVNAYLSVYMGIAAAASNPPVVKINPFYWNSIKDNSIYGTKDANTTYKNLLGHIELEDDWKETDKYKKTGEFAGGTYSVTTGQYDADPKISGQVVVTGTVHDANLIEYIKVKFGSFIDNVVVASFDDTNGTLATSTAVAESNYGTNGYWFEKNKETFSANGHDVEWTLYLNTEKVGGATVAASDVELIVTAGNKGTPSCTASDAVEGDSEEILNIAGNKKYGEATYSSPKVNTPGSTNTRRTAKTAYYRMDIVPYITEVTTKLSSSNQTTPSVYNRSALGHYPVYEFGKNSNISTYETVTIKGFNIVADTETNKSVSFTGTSNNTASLTAVSGSSNQFTVQIPSGAKSGNLTVTTDGIDSLNNVNNDNSRGDYKYTVAANGTRTDNLGAVPIEGDYTKYSNFYNRIPNNKNNNRLTDDVYFDIWQFNNEAALAYDNGMLDNLEMKINPNNGKIGFAFSSGAIRFSMAGNNSSYTAWDIDYDYLSHNALSFDLNGNSYGISVGGDINDTAGRSCDSMTLYSSRWGVQGTTGQGTHKEAAASRLRHIDTIGQNGTSATNGGTLYINKDRFQNQSLATHINSTDATKTDLYMAYYDLLNEEIRFKAGTIANAVADYGNFRNIGTGGHSYNDNAKSCQIIANGNTNTFGSAGKYVSIGVTSTNVVVLVWYDGENLKYAYNTTPLAKAETNTAPIYVNAANNGTGWVNGGNILTGGGEFCQLVVARDNSIHIAAYDSGKGDLKYIYLPSYDGDPVTCTVDAYLDVGSQLTIDVAEVNGKQIPYIGYTGAFPEKPKYAYLADPAKFYSTDANEKVVDGVSGNYFTGVWDCTVVPTQSTMKSDREISVGVWKHNGTADDNGKLAWSTTGTNRGKENGTVSASTATDSSGQCYGNGTNNGVLAYVVTPTGSKYCAETAQKK